jgi:S1-C subfamily serine protease
MQIQKDSIIGLALLSALGGAILGILVFIAFSRFYSFSFLAPQSTSTNLVAGQTSPPMETQVEMAVQKVQPSVVSILISKNVPVYVNSPDLNQLFNGTLPGQFFEMLPSAPAAPQATQRTQVGGGSGFLISTDGLIATNQHVVADPAADYTVITSDGKSYPARVLARDPSLDLAFVKIEGQNFPALPFGDSDKIKLGQTVLAVGNALDEFRNTVTMGIVSGMNRTLAADNGSGGTEVIEGAIQTDAAINPGSSGGPLVNLNGQVIGINTAMAVDSQSIGFALPSNLIKMGADQVKQTGKITHAFLGVRYQTLTSDLIQKNKLSVSHGALIVRGGAKEPAILPGSPAENAGLKENDIILQFDGKDINDSSSLSILITRHAPGDVVPVKIWRDGKEIDLQVTLGELK